MHHFHLSLSDMHLHIHHLCTICVPFVIHHLVYHTPFVYTYTICYNHLCTNRVVYDGTFPNLLMGPGMNLRGFPHIPMPRATGSFDSFSPGYTRDDTVLSIMSSISLLCKRNQCLLVSEASEHLTIPSAGCLFSWFVAFEANID